MRDASCGRDDPRCDTSQVPTLLEMTAVHNVRDNPNNWDMVLVTDFDAVEGPRPTRKTPSSRGIPRDSWGSDPGHDDHRPPAGRGGRPLERKWTFSSPKPKAGWAPDGRLFPRFMGPFRRARGPGYPRFVRSSRPVPSVSGSSVRARARRPDRHGPFRLHQHTKCLLMESREVAAVSNRYMKYSCQGVRRRQTRSSI